ncbi:MAG: ChbG/HpnK family deacetylase, partial [Bryobacteraceae bacterium]|nr:ChbG/HpnK family deacetylase [Bryobacteraceae bacterium]
GQLHHYPECAAQVRKILHAGLRLTHLDTHKHAHLLPPVAEALGRVSREFGIRWVRRPLPAPVVGWLARRRLGKHGCRMADQLLGFAETGRLDQDRLLVLVRQIPPGLSELLCHPGYCRSELRASTATRLKESRELELEALTSPAVRQGLEDYGVRLVNYSSVEAAFGTSSIPD